VGCADKRQLGHLALGPAVSASEPGPAAPKAATWLRVLLPLAHKGICCLYICEFHCPSRTRAAAVCTSFAAAAGGQLLPVHQRTAKSQLSGTRTRGEKRRKALRAWDAARAHTWCRCCRSSTEMANCGWILHNAYTYPIPNEIKARNAVLLLATCGTAPVPIGACSGSPRRDTAAGAAWALGGYRVSGRAAVGFGRTPGFFSTTRQPMHYAHLPGPLSLGFNDIWNEVLPFKSHFKGEAARARNRTRPVPVPSHPAPRPAAGVRRGHDLPTAKRCMWSKFYRPRGASLAPSGG
jgi:hypothetical protein